MADTPNPFLAALAASQGSDVQPPLDPQQQSVPAVPDTSNLPANSGPVPQPPAVPQQQAQDSGGYRGPRPILFDLMQGLISPRMVPGQIDATGVQAPSRPVSRAATFEDFLGNFVGALGKGFEASGHGPGAFARGFGGAVGAPLQMQQQQQQFAQTQATGQANIEDIQAQTAQRQKQTELSGSMVTIQTPNGPMSLPYNVAIQSGLLKGYLGAQVSAQSKMSIAELNAAAKNGAVKFVKPIQDPNNPGKVVFGAFDAQGNFLRPLDNSIDPSSLAKVNTQMQPDGNGGFVMTQQTTTRPQLPAAGGTANRIPQPSGAGAPSSRGAAPTVASVGGKPVGPLWTRPDSLGFTPDSSQLGLTQKEKQTEYNRRQDSYKKNADELSKTEGTISQFNSILDDINAGKDITGAQSVVGLFNAIGISATPLKGAGFRINSNTIQEHAEARGLGESLYQKLLSLKNGDVITPQQLKDYASIAAQSREDQYVNLANQVHNANLNADFVLPQGNGRQLDPSTARIFLRLTGADNQGRGGDPDKARAAAKAKGWKF